MVELYLPDPSAGCKHKKGNKVAIMNKVRIECIDVS